MAIRVICPGCMTSFEVGDQFAGKKGPCPKCGHIIEIPKVQLVVHAPDEVVSGGKRVKVGTASSPIRQNRFVFTGKQVFWSVAGVLGAAAIAFLVGAVGSLVLSAIVGLLAVFAIAFPIADFGYMLIRDDDDLEMFLGNERKKRSLYVALVFGGSWVVFELLLQLLGGEQGPLSLLYLAPIAVVGSFGALIFFDCNFGRAFLVYFMFAIAAVVGRGLLVQPDGWIWQEKANRAAPVAAPIPVESSTGRARPASDKNASESNATENADENNGENNGATEPAQEEKPALNRAAPPKPRLNRRR